MDPARILVVDDDPHLLMLVGDGLRRRGYAVSTAASGRDALRTFDREWCDLVVLDLMMPRMDGEEVAEAIKARANIPIVVLSAISAAESKIDLIQRFADDYVTKPFVFDELAARIERVLRRPDARLPGRELVLGPHLTLVLRRRRAVVAGSWVGLSPIETRLLGVLAAEPGTPVSTDELLARVWSHAEGADPAYVWVTIRRLRQKIEVDPDRPRYLLTDRDGGGYLLAAPSHLADG